MLKVLVIETKKRRSGMYLISDAIVTKPKTNHEYTMIRFTVLHEINYLHGI